MLNKSSYTYLPAFKAFCMKVIPLVYDNSLSYYEFLCKVADQLNILIENNNMIPDMIIEAIKDYIDSGVVSDALRELLAEWVTNVKYPPNNIVPSKGDGITDDTQSFVECLNYASNHHKCVFVPDGIYLLSNITIPEGVSLYGISNTGTRLAMIGGSSGTFITMMSNSELAELTIDSVKGNKADKVDGVVAGNGCIIKSCVINNTYTALTVNDNTQVSLVDGTNNNTGVIIMGSKNSITAKTMEVTDNGTENSYDSLNAIQMARENISLQPKQPLTYKTPTSTDYKWLSTVPFKTEGGVPYDVMVYNGGEIFNDFVNILDYGAKGDGITDDTNAFKNACSQGKGILVPDTGKAYILSDTINVSSNTKLFGVGYPILMLKSNNAATLGSLFRVDSASNVEFSGITFDGNAKNNIKYGAKTAENYESALVVSPEFMIFLVNSSDISVINCTIQNVWGSGVIADNCKNVRYLHNVVKDFRITGLSARYSSSQPGTSSNKFVISGNYVSGGIVGIHNIFGAYDNIITENNVENCKDSNAYPNWAYSGVYPNVYPSTGGYAQRSPALTVNQGDGGGIELTGGNTPTSTNDKQVTISNNTATNCMVGIRLEEQTNLCNIVGNIANNNDNTGIYLFSCEKCCVVGNTANGNKSSGISVIKLGSNPNRRHTITGNILCFNTNFGIVLTGATECTISANIFSGNLSANMTDPCGGVGLYQVSDNPCLGNIITGNEFNKDGDLYGVYSNDNTNNVNNLINGNMFIGLSNNSIIPIPSNNTIANNVIL